MTGEERFELVQDRCMELKGVPAERRKEESVRALYGIRSKQVRALIDVIAPMIERKAQ
jgi:hypothetical protein